MYSTGDYPLGAANDPRAPYNEVENPEVEVELFVWKGIGKRIKVKTKDYRIIDQGVDEDGSYYCERDFSDTDFWSLIEEQCPPPEGWEQYDSDFTIE